MRIFPFLKYSGNKGVYLYCLIFILSPFFAESQSDKKFLKYALKAFEQEAYVQAANNFKEIDNLHKQSLSNLIIYLDCLVKNAELDDAFQLVELIEIRSKGKPPAQYYFIKGKLNHLNGSFNASIDDYKTYIRLAEIDDPLRVEAKANLLSCSYARRNNSWREGVGVLPFKSGVNSTGDELKPMFSKNLNGVFYFGSANDKSIGGLRSNEGEADAYIGSYKIDMFKAQRDNNGFTVRSLSYLLNSIEHDILAGFSEDGQILYFGKGNTYDNLKIYADTFEQDINKRKLKADPYKGFTGSFTRYGLPYFYSDKVILFASNQLGGYGGYDLFVSYYSNGKWSSPENLGAEVNTAYNEVSPFLAKNGRSLYYSTNDPNISYGGYDVVQAIFKPHDFSWSEVRNMGKPINSYGDDLDFCLSNNGVSALFSSNRPGGEGGFDLYNVLFEEQVEEQLTQLSAFIFGKNFENIDSSNGKDNLNNRLRPLYYGKSSELLSLSNEEYLKQIAKRLRENKELRLILEVHSNDKDQNQTNSFLAFQRGLIIKDFLEDYGVYNKQIRVRSFSSYYPLAKARDEDDNETYYGQRVNNRVDLHLWSMNDEFVEEAYQWPLLDSLSRDKSFDDLASMLSGISYAVEVFQSDENIQDPILYRYNPMVINASLGKDKISFQLGMFKNFGSANTLLNSLNVLGYDQASISVFLNGYELEGEELDLFRSRFPGISWP